MWMDDGMMMKKNSGKSRKTEIRQIMLSLSIVSLIMAAVLVNDSVTGRNRPVYIVSDNSSSGRIEQLNRAIASAHPMDPFHDLEWERQLAKKLGSADERKPASVSRRISSVDELRYGPLAGNYRFVASTTEDEAKAKAKTEAQPGIKEIEFVDPVDVAAKPVFLEPETFLTKYGSLLSVSFDSYHKTSVQTASSQQEYELLKDEKVVGVAQFQMDSDGKFLGLKVRTAALQSP
jgi:hypothetical protein